MECTRGDSKQGGGGGGGGGDVPVKEANSLGVPLLANTESSIHDELHSFRICLRWCALDHSSPCGRAASCAVFLALTVMVPAAVSLSIRTPLTSFDKLVQLPVSGLAVVSFLTLAAFFRRYTLRQLLFLDSALRLDSAAVRRGYARALGRAFRDLVYILLPSFAVELAHKILFYSAVPAAPPLAPWKHIAFFVATLVSWVYRTGVFLLVCMLFRLTCALQILRFEGLCKMFDIAEPGRAGAAGPSSDAWTIFRVHVRIKRQLLVTSHRYRIFIILSLVTITISQLGALMLVFASKSDKNFRNSGDVVVFSAVQLSGFVMCLLGAARMTHRAQRIVSIASRWHMIMSCASHGKLDASPVQKQTLDQAITSELQASESDPASKLSDASSVLLSLQQESSFERRQALVTYLQHNSGGITLFGFALDRGLLHTLFVFEMTLVLWILSKVVVLS